MATITSTATGLWSAGGTWVGGVVPADNDVVVIATGHVVTFDVDQSGFANGVDGITVTGTLKLSRTTSGYMMIKAAKTIGGAGTFDCGTDGDAIPFAVKHTITGGAAWFIQGSGGLTMTVYAAEPTTKTILLTALEPIGETVLAVDTDVMGDIWADGDKIRIDDINKTVESEERIIAVGGIAAGTITITVGLTLAKSTGAVVSLISRNVKFVGVGAAGYVAQNFAAGKLTIAGGEWYTANYRVFNACPSIVISGGAFHSSNLIVILSHYALVSGGVFSGNTQAFQQCNSLTISGGSFSGSSQIVYIAQGTTVSGGTFKGNNNVLYTLVGITVLDGLFSGNGYVIRSNSGVNVAGGVFTNNTSISYECSGTIKNASSSGNTFDLRSSVFNLFNTVLGSSTENTGYLDLSRESYSESINHDQVVDAFIAWTKGGVTASQAVVLPTSYTLANQTTMVDASNEGYWQKEVTVGAGASVSMDIWLRKDASMTYLPNCIIFNKAATDPFAGGTGVHTFTMTDSVDTWENETYVYTNNTASSVSLIIRFQGKNATGNFFSAITLDVLNVDLTTLITSTNALTTAVSGMWNTAENTLTTTGTIGNKLARMTIVGE